MTARRLLILTVTAAICAGVAFAQGPAAPPAPPAAPQNPNVPDPNGPVAIIYGNVKVTRGELGEFLMARGGSQRLDLLVNKVIIEAEARRRGVTVTETEMVAAFNSDLEGMSVDKAMFVNKMLPEYQKTLYEWMEDVIRPKLLLTKMIQDKVQISEADIDVEMGKEFGEQRVLQTIVWPLDDDLKAIELNWGKLRDSVEEYDRAARSQANRSLAAAGGMARPITRYTHGTDDLVTKRAFQLKGGEVSEILKTGVGYMVIKLVKVIPPSEPKDVAKARAIAQKRALELKINEEQPKLFAELRKQADPEILYTGPALWKEAKDVVRGEKPVQAVLPAGAKVVK